MSYERSDELTLNGRHITKGTELSITGLRGRFPFVQHVRCNDTEWIDVLGPHGIRSFYLDRIKTVHRKKRS